MIACTSRHGPTTTATQTVFVKYVKCKKSRECSECILLRVVGQFCLRSAAFTFQSDPIRSEVPGSSQMRASQRISCFPGVLPLSRVQADSDGADRDLPVAIRLLRIQFNVFRFGRSLFLLAVSDENPRNESKRIYRRNMRVSDGGETDCCGRVLSMVTHVERGFQKQARADLFGCPCTKKKFATSNCNEGKEKKFFRNPSKKFGKNIITQNGRI